MTARSVLLAMTAASFLRGDEELYVGGDDRQENNDSKGATSSGNRTSLAQRWRECDQQAQLSLASANPQVRKHNSSSHQLHNSGIRHNHQGKLWDAFVLQWLRRTDELYMFRRGTGAMERWNGNSAFVSGEKMKHSSIRPTYTAVVQVVVPHENS